MGFATLLDGQLRQGGVYLIGSEAERSALFGAPLPRIPPGDPDAAGVERVGVEISAHLGEAFARWLAIASRNLASAAAAMAAAGSAEESAEREYREALQETLRAVVAGDRRQGLVNLFWLAHSRELAAQIERRFTQPDAAAEARYRLHPLLSGIMRRAEEGWCTAAGRPQRALLDFRRGVGSNDALARAVIDDQLPLTEADPRAFDPVRVLVPENQRFRIGAAAFLEIREILRARLARALADGERGVLAALERAGVTEPAVPPDAARGWDRLVFAEPVREHLLHDVEGTAAQLLRSKVLCAELTGGRSWGELLEAFADVTRCVRRAEAVHLLRLALDVSAVGGDRDESRERYLEGRLFRFGTTHAVQSGLRRATILFADIRDFTRASEGAVSEGQLARELYEIFDPAALIVRRFGGSVDAYLGDGFMATFAAGSRPGEEAVAAIRTAVALQQVLDRLRRLGRTDFRMGISLHAGRVAVARFLRDEEQVTATVIGRQVNIAARLSASEGGQEVSGQGGGARVVGEVAVDGEGRLLNRGIAVSGPLVEVLQGHVPCEPFSENGIEGVRWYDQDLCLWLHLGYVGVARFRSVEAAIPVYSLGHAAPMVAHGAP